MNTKNVLVATLVLAALVGTGWYVITKPANTGVLTIGLVAPLSGDAAAYGEPIRDAVAIAVDEINAHGGVSGREVKMIYEDGKCNGKDAVTAAQKLVSVDRVRLIIGGACSGETLAIAPITEAAKVILFSSYASSPDITHAGDFVFRNHVSDVYAGEAMAQTMIRTYKKAAIVSETTNYAEGIRDAFLKSYSRVGGTVVASESFISDTKDFRSIFSKVRTANPEAIFLNAQSGAAAARMAKQARELGLAQQFYVAYVAGPEFLSAGQAVEGTMVVDDPGFNSKNSKAVAFAADYRARYGKDPNYPFAAGASYDIVYLIRDAVRNVGENTEKIRDYFYDLPNFDGVAGSYHFDGNGDVEGLGLGLKKIQNGKLIEL